MQTAATSSRRSSARRGAASTRRRRSAATSRRCWCGAARGKGGRRMRCCCSPCLPRLRRPPAFQQPRPTPALPYRFPPLPPSKPPSQAAVAHLHALGIVHRDIKPENVLLVGAAARRRRARRRPLSASQQQASEQHTPQQQQPVEQGQPRGGEQQREGAQAAEAAGGALNMRAKLADFGLSIDAGRERPVTRAGTLDYMAPEVLLCPDKRLPGDGKADAALPGYGAAADVWCAALRCRAAVASTRACGGGRCGGVSALVLAPAALRPPLSEASILTTSKQRRQQQQQRQGRAACSRLSSSSAAAPLSARAARRRTRASCTGEGVVWCGVVCRCGGQQGSGGEL